MKGEEILSAEPYPLQRELPMRSPRRSPDRRRAALDALLTRVYLGIAGLFLAVAPVVSVVAHEQDPASWPTLVGCVLLALVLLGAGLLLISLRGQASTVQRLAGLSMIAEASLVFVALAVPITLLLLWSRRRRLRSLRGAPLRIRPRKAPLWAHVPAPRHRPAAPTW